MNESIEDDVGDWEWTRDGDVQEGRIFDEYGNETTASVNAATALIWIDKGSLRMHYSIDLSVSDDPHEQGRAWVEEMERRSASLVQIVASALPRT